MGRKNKENTMTTKAMKCQLGSDLESDLDSNNNKSNLRNGKNYEKYSLRPRSIQNRIETEKRQKEVKKKPKPKQKPPPLSKYRRKTANARERGRMREINEAFESLQRTVPQYPILPVNAQGKTCEKLTKITTLRLAMNYIEALAQLLNNPPVVSMCSSPQSSSSISASTSTSISTSPSEAGSSISSLADLEINYSSPTSSIISGNFSSSASDFSPASSFTMSPISMSMSSCSPAPDCIQTVMRSVVSPASAAATAAAAAAAAANSSNLRIPPNSIPHQQLNINRINIHTNLNHNHNLNLNSHSHHPRTVNLIHSHNNPNLPVNLNSINIPLNGNLISQQSSPGMSLSPLPVVPSFSPPMSMSPSSLSSSSPNSAVSISSPKIINNHHQQKMTTKLPPISSSLSSALLKRSMSSFIADCAHMTGVINNNGNRTGSLSSLTESDLSEYASDLLSDEGSTLDDPMFDDLIGVGVATDLELLLESDGDSLHFSSDLSDS